MSQHTPGPWSIREVDGVFLIREGNDGYSIASVWPDDSRRERADAHLIAAAPDLLKAALGARYLLLSLRALREGATDELIDSVTNRLEEVIAKAEGR